MKTATKLKKVSPALNAPRVFPGCVLFDLRKKLGLTRQQMADEIGIANSCLWKLEQGTDVKLSFAMKIAKAYGKCISEIWPGP